MSQIYRLFGVDFSPARLDIHAIPALGKTGFEVGAAYTFGQRPLMQFREYDIFNALGISQSSEEAMEFEDHVKYGNNVLVDFVRDILAGREHAASHRRMVKEAINKLEQCLIYSKQNRMDVECCFPPEVLVGFGEGDFLLSGVCSMQVNASDMFAHPFAVKGGKLWIGPEQNVEFRLHEEFVYTQDTCRAVHNYVGTIVESLYSAIADHMEQEFHNQAVDYVRKQIEARSVMAYGESENSIPNFYLLIK